MNQTTTQLSEIRALERQLQSEEDFRQRLVVLDRLVDYYVFTNVQKAQSHLSELKTALQFSPNRDIQLNFHQNNALVENQLYNYRLAEIHLSKALSILDEIGMASQQIDTFIDYAGVLINLKRHVEAATFLEKAATMLQSFPNDRLEARMICREGYLQLFYRKQEKAVELLLQAEQKINRSKGALELKDYYFLTLIYSGLGTIYSKINAIEDCLDVYLKVLDICNTRGMKTRLSWHYLNVGNAFMVMGEIEEASMYFQKAIKSPDDISQSARAGASANLGYCSFLKGDFKEALGLYNRAERLYKEKGERNFAHLFSIERWKAELYKATGKEKKTQKHLIAAFKYAQKTDDSKTLSAILEDIADYYSEIGEFENAYAYQKLHTQASIRYYDESKERQVKELQIKYEAEKRKQEAELLELEATKLQLKALRAQMNPHFMHNALNSIQRYIMSNEADTASHFLARFAKLMRHSLEYSDMESISLEKEIAFLEDYLTINQKLRFDDLEYQISIDEQIEEDIMGVPTMIIQPYVENAIEHGLRTKKNGLLKVRFSLLDEDTILCTVDDNGIGRSGAAQLQELDKSYNNYQSMGTSITERRLKLLQNTHNFNNLSVEIIDLFDQSKTEPLGTKVLIRIPIVDIKLK